MVDIVLATAAKAAAISFFNRGYNQENNAANYAAYCEANNMAVEYHKGSRLFKAGYYDSRTGEYLGAGSAGSVSKSGHPGTGTLAERVSKARYETNLKIVQLERAARDWRAKDAPGVPIELRRLYRDRAAVAEKAARELEATMPEMPPAPLAGNQPSRRTGNRMADDSHVNGLLAQAEAEDRMADELEARASAKMDAAPAHLRDVVRAASEQARQHRAEAAMHRARAEGHRRAASAFRTA